MQGVKHAVFVHSCECVSSVVTYCAVTFPRGNWSIAMNPARTRDLDNQRLLDTYTCMCMYIYVHFVHFVNYVYPYVSTSVCPCVYAQMYVDVWNPTTSRKEDKRTET